MAFNVSKISVAQVLDPYMTDSDAPSDKRVNVLSEDAYLQNSRSDAWKAWQVEQLRRDVRASFESSRPWYVRFGKGLLGVLSGPAGCGGNNGNNGTGNNNNVRLDATVDAADAADAGDAQPPDADASVPTYVCIEEGREGIIDDKQILVTGTYGCNVADIEHFEGAFHLVCAYPNNRLLTYHPQSNQLVHNGNVTTQLQGPYGTEGDVYPAALSVFEHDDDPGRTVLGVTFQTRNTVSPGDVRGGVYLHDAQTGARMDRADLSLLIFHGGAPEGDRITFFDPVGSIFSQGRLWVAPENYSPVTNGFVTSFVSAYAVVKDEALIRFSRDVQPLLGSSSMLGHRPAGVARVDDAVVACSYGGVAAASPADAHPPMIAFFDTSSAQDGFLTATRSLALGLESTWQLTALPRIGVSHDKKHYVVAAENPSQQQRRIAVLTLSDPGDLAGTTHTVQTFDITPYAKGRVMSVLVDGMRVYVTEEGDPNAPVDTDKFGTMIVFDIDPESGNLAFKKQIPLGMKPRAASLDPATGKIYQPVTQANCKEAGSLPHLMELDPSLITGLRTAGKAQSVDF